MMCSHVALTTWLHTVLTLLEPFTRAVLFFRSKRREHVPVRFGKTVLPTSVFVRVHDKRSRSDNQRRGNRWLGYRRDFQAGTLWGIYDESFLRIMCWFALVVRCGVGPGPGCQLPLHCERNSSRGQH